MKLLYKVRHTKSDELEIMISHVICAQRIYFEINKCKGRLDNLSFFKYLQSKLFVEREIRGWIQC